MKHGHSEHRKFMSKKIKKLRAEGYAQAQAVAIAHDMARKKYGGSMMKKMKEKGR